jgi:regulator of protease activity HflC (stomatin/prohibitin superfamily)
MRLDLDTEAVDLSALPRFQLAQLQARRLLTLTVWMGAIAIGLLMAARYVPAIAANPLWRSLLLNNGAAFLLLFAASQAAYWVVSWRCRVNGTALYVLPAWLRSSQRTDTATQSRWYQRLPRRLLAMIVAAARRLMGEVLRSLWLCALTVIALLAVIDAWTAGATPVASNPIATIVGGIALLTAFCMLVLERYYANHSDTQWPEATQLGHFVRICIATLLLSCVCLFFGSAEQRWPMRVAAVAGVLPGIVAAEIALRAVLSLFVRSSNRIEPRFAAQSVFLGTLRWPPRPLQSLHDELRNRFGIDLRQTWAFAHMRGAIVPVVLTVAATGWLLSGVRQIPIEGRGIYERFGKPIAVLGSGLHVGLPIPFSKIRAVENGVVRELVTTVGGEEEGEPDNSTAEGAAPTSANRLWDASHVSENSQVIASASGDKQGFQVVYMDVRFIYRIALTDAAALAATYNTQDVPAIIRSTAGRVLVRDFASRTLENVLGEARVSLGRDVAAAVQTELSALNSGVEILSTLIEAVHPPAGAADAYHAVQAAQIKAQATIARERGRAAQQVNDAQLQATMARDKAAAQAHEAKASAEVVQSKFVAERDAYRKAGAAFVLEQYLSQLGVGLAAAELIILDHRIKGAQAPTLDLRVYAGARDATSAVP